MHAQNIHNHPTFLAGYVALDRQTPGHDGAVR